MSETRIPVRQFYVFSVHYEFFLALNAFVTFLALSMMLFFAIPACHRKSKTPTKQVSSESIPMPAAEQNNNVAPPSLTKTVTEVSCKSDAELWWTSLPEAYLKHTQLYERAGKAYLVSDDYTRAELDKASIAELEGYERDMQVAIGNQDRQLRQQLRTATSKGPKIKMNKNDAVFAAYVPAQQEIVESRISNRTPFGIKSSKQNTPRQKVVYYVDAQECENTQWSISAINDRQNRDLVPQRAKYLKRKRKLARKSPPPLKSEKTQRDSSNK